MLEAVYAAAAHTFTILGSRRGTRLCTTVRRFAMPRRYVHAGEKLAFWMRVSSPFPPSLFPSVSVGPSLLRRSVRGNPD